MFEWIIDPNAWMALATLTFLEIVLGIDNIIILSLIVTKLPKHQQNIGRKYGLFLAMMMRISLLTSIAWIVKLSYPLFHIHQWQFLSTNTDVSHLNNVFSVNMRDIILFFGGLFLMIKGTKEIKEMFHLKNEQTELKSKKSSFFAVIVEIIAIDILFSLDSVITAVGLSDHISIMILAVIISVIIMMFAVKAIGDFVEKNPTFKMLAIVFIVLIGFVLVTESIHIHVPKSYIYLMIAFSLFIEMLNLLRIKSIKNSK